MKSRGPFFFFFLSPVLLVPDAKTHCLIQGYKDLVSWGVFRVDFESQVGFCPEGRRGRPGLARQSGGRSLQGSDVPEPPVGTDGAHAPALGVISWRWPRKK